MNGRPCPRSRALGTLSALAIAGASSATARLARTGTTAIYTPAQALTTMQNMAGYVDAALSTPYVIDRANAMIAGAPPRDWPAQVDAIRQYLEHSFRFVDNPVGRQRIQPVAEMLARIQRANYVQGACNDAATLVASLGMANGLPARFVAYAFCATAGEEEDPPYTHVIADLFDGTQWRSLDITRPWEMFRLPCVDHRLELDLTTMQAVEL